MNRAEAIATISKSDEHITWIAVPRKSCGSKKTIENFRQAIYRGLVKLGLWRHVRATTRGDAPYVVVVNDGRRGEG